MRKLWTAFNYALLIICLISACMLDATSIVPSIVLGIALMYVVAIIVLNKVLDLQL